MNQPRYYLLVEVGPAKGQRHFISGNGVKLGRSSQNDICIVDPQLSRQHCQFEFRDGKLWIKDLGSANFTMVNNAQIFEKELFPGDLVQVGETALRVVTEDAPLPAGVTPAAAISPPGTGGNADPAPPPPVISIPDPSAPAPQPPPAEPMPPPAVPKIDLGLRPAGEPAAPKKSNTLRALLYLAGALLVLIIGVVMIADLEPKQNESSAPPAAVDQTLQIIYEQVDASPDNIFRFYISLSPRGLLSVRMHDLKQGRTVQKEKTVSPEDIQMLAKKLGPLHFDTLDAAYTAQNPQPGHLSSHDLTLVIGKRAHRAVVQNRPEPPLFKQAREDIEIFTKNELNIWDVFRSTEDLIQGAADNLLAAQNYFNDANIDHSNLWYAIAKFREAEKDLESVNPKPGFYPDIITGLETAREELERRFNELRYSADREMNLSQWEKAREYLQLICRLVPDQKDDRNRTATRQLVDVENRLRR